MRDWYNPPQQSQTQTGPAITWNEILQHLESIILDVHETYGIELDNGAIHTRTWPWFERRAIDLITKTETRIHHKLKHHFAQ